MVAALQTLRTVINELIQVSETSEYFKPKYYAAAIRGYRYLNQTVIADAVIVEKYEPNDLNRISMPSDMEDFIGLGVPIHGELYWLTRNDKIIPTTTEENGEDTLDSSFGEGVDIITSQIQSKQSLGGINYEGYYTLDWKNRKIIINANRQTELALAYKSNGIETSTETYIPARCVPALHAFIMWETSSMNPSTPRGVKADYKAHWLDWERRLKRMTVFTLQEFEDLITSTRTLLPR